MADQKSHMKSFLILGWQVTQQMDPRYWLRQDAKLGEQEPDDLFEVPADQIGSHTAIVAQSGSGKSYFLGRLIEEILLNTRARCVILDPNADFRKVHEIELPDLWTKAGYNLSRRVGRLPHESSREEFEARWANISHSIRIRTGGGQFGSGPNYERLQLWWPSLSVEILAEDVNPMLRSDLYHCHSFVSVLGELLGFKHFRRTEGPNKAGTAPDQDGGGMNLIDAAQRLFRLARGLVGDDYRTQINDEFNFEAVTRTHTRTTDFGGDPWLEFGEMAVPRSYIEQTIKRFLELVGTLNESVSSEVQRYYFGRAREYQAAGILQTEIKAPWEVAQRSNTRLDVVDLPSLPKNTKHLALSAILTTEWDRVRRGWERALRSDPDSDTRVPTFIVVDEAHNLIPAEPQSKVEAALRDQFRTFAAEGRKYGLFLILVSQRPDKLDPLVLSECENRAVMRLGSRSVLDITRRMLGLDDIAQRTLERCLEFELGRALLIGRWAPEGPQVIYSAPRRTVEGGRNLRADYWARPDDDSETEASSEHATRAPDKVSRQRNARYPARASQRTPRKASAKKKSHSNHSKGSTGAKDDGKFEA